MSVFFLALVIRLIPDLQTDNDILPSSEFINHRQVSRTVANAGDEFQEVHLLYPDFVRQLK